MDRANPSANGALTAPTSKLSVEVSKQESHLVIGVVKEAETLGSKSCTLANIEIEKDRNLLILIKNTAGFLVGQPVIYDKKRQEVRWVENDTAISESMFRVLAVVKATSGIPGVHQIECPECKSPVGGKELAEHLEITHGLPRRPFGFR
jgi:hypothetical protein